MTDVLSAGIPVVLLVLGVLSWTLTSGGDGE